VQEVGFVVEFLQAAVVSIDLGYLRHTLAEISQAEAAALRSGGLGLALAPRGVDRVVA
jgi:hypothetical protein